MNELTTVLDELDNEAATASGGNYPLVRPRHLSQNTMSKLVTTLRLQGGDMGRVASVIADLLAEREEEGLPKHTYPARPKGNVLVPDGKHDVCTRTAGNGTMTGDSF